MLVATGARWAAAIGRVGCGPFWRPTDTTPGGGMEWLFGGIGAVCA